MLKFEVKFEIMFFFYQNFSIPQLRTKTLAYHQKPWDHMENFDHMQQIHDQQYGSDDQRNNRYKFRPTGAAEPRLRPNNHANKTDEIQNLEKKTLK